MNHRGLNYNKYFTEGEEQISTQNDYNSHNARHLTVKEIKEVLLQEEFIKEILQ